MSAWHVLLAPLPSTAVVREQPVLNAELREVHAASVHDSVGGRFEADGAFRGTRWHGVTREKRAASDDDTDDDHEDVELTPSHPTDADVEALRTLVADVLARWNPSGPRPKT